MSKARLIITAVVVEGRSQREVARAYGVNQGWVSRLVARYRAEGEAAFQPRSRRPKASPTAIPPATVTLVTELRGKLTTAGLDAGPDTIAWHLAHHHGTRVSAATISRYLTRLGLVTPQPAKRPKASYQRFQAELPNECWQADFTHYPLAGPGDPPAGDAEVLTWLDDHSRYALDVTAHQPVTGPIVRDRFLAALTRFGVPASTLTDNGMVFTTRFAGGRGGRNALEAELRRRNVEQKNSRPNKPTTCGKVERFQQTLKKWLAAQPVQPATVAQLQALLDAFTDEYNHRRPHRSLPGRATPAGAYQARPKAAPTDRRDTHDRVRHDRIDADGKVTLRVNGRLHHLGIGRTHARTPVLLLVHDLHVRVVDAATGELLRELAIDPARDYQPIHPPKAETASPRTPTEGSG
jgi:transposase InsO family protein